LRGRATEVTGLRAADEPAEPDPLPGPLPVAGGGNIFRDACVWIASGTESRPQRRQNDRTTMVEAKVSMPMAQADAPTPRKPLRLWPGVAAAVLLCVTRYVLPVVVPGTIAYGMIGAVVGALAI